MWNSSRIDSHIRMRSSAGTVEGVIDLVEAIDQLVDRLDLQIAADEHNDRIERARYQAQRMEEGLELERANAAAVERIRSRRAPVGRGDAS